MQLTNKLLNWLLIIAIAIILFILFVDPYIIVVGNMNYDALPTSDKYDGGCTGFETAGRCANKPLTQTNTPQADHYATLPSFSGK